MVKIFWRVWKKAKCIIFLLFNLTFLFSANASKSSIGKIVIAKPGDVISGSTPCLTAETEEDANIIKEYLERSDVHELFTSMKTTASNSKKYFQYIQNPLYEKG